MRKYLLLLSGFLFLLSPVFDSDSLVFARDPYPNKERVKFMVAPQMIEDPYGNGPATDPQTMLRDTGVRSDIISFGCIVGDYVNYLNDLDIDTKEKATTACNSRYRGNAGVVEPILKNNKGATGDEIKYDASGYDWPIGNFLGRHPKAEKRGWQWVTPLVYSSLYGVELRSSRCQGGVCAGCYFAPSGPESTWVRLTRTKDARGNPVNQECFAPPYTASGAWWEWLKGELANIKGHADLSSLASVGVFFGIDGEGRPLKSGDNWVPDDRGLESRFYGEYIPAVVKEIKRLYPGTTVRAHTDNDSSFMLENEVDFHRESLAADGVHSYLYKGLGQFGWWQGFANYFWITNSVGLGNWVPMYQSAMAALSLHTDAITGIITGELRDSTKREGEFLKFFGSYIGKDINDTPGVWSLLRETVFKKEDLNNVSGKYGDYDYFLYRAEDLDGNLTVPVAYPEVEAVAPGTADQIYTKASNPIRTMGSFIAGRKVAPGSRYMSFDVDDGYRYAGKVSSYDVRIVYLDIGNESFKFQYKDVNGNWQEKIIAKTNTKLWQEAILTIDGAFFNNNGSEGINADKYPTDFRLDFESGSTVIHFIEVAGVGNVNVSARPKAQVSCDIVLNENDDPKDGVYSIGINQDLRVKAVLTDQEGRPLLNERVMFTYNTEWNLAKSSKTNASGASFMDFSTRNRLNSSGFVWNYKYSIYTFQAYYPGSAQYQPSRNDCHVLTEDSRGPSDSMNTRIKILNVDQSGVSTTGMVKIRYQVIDGAGTVIADKDDYFGKAQTFYANDLNLQTFPIYFNDGTHHVAFTNVSVRGSGVFPTVSPPPTSTPGGPMLTPTLTPTPSSGVLTPTPSSVVPTPTPSSPEISLNEGWNKVFWQSDYPIDRRFGDVPDACKVVETSESNYWRVFVKGYGGENLSFERGREYFVKCDNALTWRL